MPDRPDDDTLPLLRAAQAGDAEATDRLLERYRGRLLQVVCLLMARRPANLPEDEEDIVQETLLEAVQNLGSFTPRSEGSLLHWLAKLAENNLRDALRREGAQKRGEGRVRRRADLPSTFLISSCFPGREPTPSQAVSRDELAAALETFLIALPDKQRRAFVMRQMCALSFDEIARELDLASAASARMLFSRAAASVSVRLAEVVGPVQ